MADNRKYNAATQTLTGDRINIYMIPELGESDVDASKDFTASEPIAFATSCSIDVTADTIDSSNKMGGNWKNTRVGQLGWTAQIDALVSTDGSHLSFAKLLAIATERKAVGIALAIVSGEEDDFESLRDAGFVLEATDKCFAKGKAFITSINQNSGTGNEVVSYSATLTGDGPLYVGGTAGSAA